MIMIALSSFLCTIVVHIYFRADTFCKMPFIFKKVKNSTNNKKNMFNLFSNKDIS